MDYVIDSYAWLEYFGGNRKYAAYVEAGAPVTVATTITEVIRSLKRKGKTDGEVMRAVQFIAEKSIVLPIEKDNAVKAGFITQEQKLHFSDALIYSFAGKNRRVVTGDDDFRKLEHVEFVE